MKNSRDISQRMQNMLTRDKLNVQPGFLAALTSDINRVLKDYFSLDAPAFVEVNGVENGRYTVIITAGASKILTFSTTVESRKVD